uniref:Chemokine interleukin-8-like domain-containing protein n=1 Tax=Myripristis murdjan TaxID=586833 RepID=A0A667YJ15_9TELE
MRKPNKARLFLHMNSSLGLTHSNYRCICQRTTSVWIPPRAIRKVVVNQPGGRCRQTEIIVTLKRNNRSICISPEAKWLDKFFRESLALQK